MSNEISVLTEKQKRIAEHLALAPLANEKVTYQSVAEQFGISTHTLRKYRELPEFIRYQNEISQIMLDSMTSEVNARLVEIIRNGSDNTSLKGIDLFYKVQGKLKTGNTTVNIERPKEDLEREIKELERRLEKQKQDDVVDGDFEELN